MRDKNHMIISTDAEEANAKSQCFKSLSKLGIEGMFLNIIKSTCDTVIANTILNAEKQKVFPLKSGTTQG
jgi:hypothetical protein